MILKTSCENCVFLNNGCDIGHPIFLTEGKQETLGFCNMKRAKEWLKKQSFTEAPDVSSIKLAILNENSNISVILVDVNGNIDAVKDKLSKLEKSFSEKTVGKLASIYIVTSMKGGFSMWKQEVLNNFSFAPIQLEFMTGEFTVEDGMDYLSMMPHTNKVWFMDVEEYVTAEEMHSGVVGSAGLDRHIAIYFSDNNFITNKFAYKQLLGNKEQHYMHKIFDSFTNYNDFVLEITNEKNSNSS